MIARVVTLAIASSLLWVNNVYVETSKVPSPRISFPPWTALSGWVAEVCDEIRSKRVPLVQYRDKIVKKIENSVESFRKQQLTSTTSAEDEIKRYIDKLNDLYDDALNQLRLQQEAIAELNKEKPFRSPIMDESLEQFRRLYNESMGFVVSLPQSGAKHVQQHPFVRDWFVRNQKYSGPPPSKANRVEPFSKRIDRLDKSLQRQWKSVVDVAKEGATSTDRLIRQVLNDISNLQENATSTAKVLSEKSKRSILETISINDVKRESELLNEQLKRLEKESRLWLDEKVTQLETAIKTVQEKVSSSTSLYEELVSKKRGSIFYSAMNDATLSQVLRLIDPTDKGWQLIRSQEGVTVFRKFMGGGGVQGQSFKYAVVKAEGVLRASPKDILKLFEDNTRVTEYNKYFLEGRDLEDVAENTKVVWASSPPIFPFKPRDFCTIVHFRKLKDGTVVVLNRAAEHAEAPVTSQYVRAKIVLGANIIQPVPRSPHLCKLTMITQVDPGGFAPPMIVNQICTFGPVGFFKQVEAAARRPKSPPAVSAEG